MPTIPRAGLWTIRVAVVLALLFFSCGPICHALQCEDEMLAGRDSPGGDYRAKFIRTNCGAMSSFSYRVDIVPRHRFAWATTVLRLEPDAARKARLDVDFGWLSPTRVDVAFDSRLVVYEQRTEAGAVKVDFSERLNSFGTGSTASETTGP